MNVAHEKMVLEMLFEWPKLKKRVEKLEKLFGLPEEAESEEIPEAEEGSASYDAIKETFKEAGEKMASEVQDLTAGLPKDEKQKPKPAKKSKKD